MTNNEVNRFDETKTAETANNIEKVTEMPTETSDSNLCNDKFTIDSEVIYLQRRKVRRIKSGGIF